VTYRGGEKVLESFCKLYPDADLFTFVHDPAQLPDPINRRRITTSMLQRLPGATRHYPSLLPLMPLAARRLDLRGYDLVISSDAAVIKGVRTTAEQLHVCYCYSPPRYAWDLQDEYLRDRSRPGRLAARGLLGAIRRFDAHAARGVDRFIAISRTVADRIQRHYRRPAPVVYPPVDVEQFRPAGEVGDHYLLAGQLVPYKRPDLAVEAFAQLGLPLRVVGDGPLLERLRRQAPSNVQFLGRVDAAAMRHEMAVCRALVFPGEEDFGIVPVEAMACGRPVIALARGGATETVVGPVVGESGAEGDLEGATGLFFRHDEPASLAQAVRRFEDVEQAFEPDVCRARATIFAEPQFRRKFDNRIQRWVAEHAATIR